MAKRKTPMLDELEKGKWPSFVSDIRQEAEWRNKTDVDLQTPKEVCDDLLDLLELSLKDRECHWKHGGVAGVFGYGGGVIGRYSDRPEEFPAVKDFHTLRVNQPSSYFYKTDFLRQLCELWERRGSGITNMHGSTGDIILLGTTTPQLEEIFWELTHNLKQDLGGSGSNLRSPNCCIGKSRCEFACYDTQEACRNFTMEYQDELHRPSFGYKFKMKFDGCPNGCVASIARSDMSVIGTWKDDIRIDQEAVRAYVGGEFKPDGGAHAGRDWGPFDIVKEVIDLCPTHCMAWNGNKLGINHRECNRCMHCINTMPRALRIGKETGASILFGAKAPILEGAQLSTLTIPFMPMEEPFSELKELIEKIWDWWSEEGRSRERLGELMQRKGFAKFLEICEVKPDPRMIKEPRSNPYIFWKEADIPGGWERDIKDFRKRHQK
jgi:sulfite reductase alpha subunit